MTDHSSRLAVLLTSYRPAALGRAGYSHTIVAEMFRPLLQKCAVEVHPVPAIVAEIDRHASDCRRRGLTPVHVSVTPLQDMALARTAANVAMPAWEFPDVPDHPFGGNPQNDWVRTANRCDLLLVSGPFTENALRRGGVHAPIRTVPVPTPNAYFAVPPRRPGEEVTLSPCEHYERVGLPSPLRGGFDCDTDGLSGGSSLLRAGCAELARRTYRHLVRPTLGRRLSRALFEGLRAGRQAYRTSGVATPQFGPLRLRGVVYLSVFNPGDGRKNWQDLLTAFCAAMADEPTATLVVKLVTSQDEAVERVLSWYRGRDMRHRCRLVFVTGRLSDDEMVELVRGCDYYVQATRAEGNCLPLMTALAAGRPAITPSHTAISDYFDDGVGFPVEWHPEPAAWPHDPQLRLRTTWARVVWPSLVDQIRASHRLRTETIDEYVALAERCRLRMGRWSNEESVSQALAAALRPLAAGLSDAAVKAA